MNLEQQPNSSDLSHEDYMKLQTLVISKETQNPEFIAEVKNDLNLDREPNQNELVMAWIKENSARFRDDLEFRNEKINNLELEN